ncbi:uncharacterized protein PAC_09856 [Phialocephala subalpina]|uniref:Extracellular membrane protein CFEM domain-containing protein n=1 Tax=Phialocephala subalpina TaxID=576137 RepID=A0A1L7X4K8_9HELO|nr:uncharacterized protein PAC_09856 [Phialocephala subalpina]
MSSRIQILASAILALSTFALGKPLARRDTSECHAVSVTTTTATVPLTIVSTSTFTPPPSSIATKPINSSILVIETSVQATASNPAQTSASAVAPPNNCHHNNCLRQFLRHPQVSAFCATYTTTINTATTNLPDYASQCHADPTRISSACSCVVTDVVAQTSGTAQTSTILPSSKIVSTSAFAGSVTPASIASTSAKHHTRTNNGTFTTRTHHHHHSHSAVPATSSFESGMCFASVVYETFTETTTYLVTLTGSSSWAVSNATTIAPVVSSALITSDTITASASVFPSEH